LQREISEKTPTIQFSKANCDGKRHPSDTLIVLKIQILSIFSFQTSDPQYLTLRNSDMPSRARNREGRTILNQRVMIEGQTEAFDQLLAEYSAGTLPRPLHVLVASHLELSGRNRAFVRRLESSLARDFELSDTEAPVRERSARLNAIFNSSPDAEAPRACLRRSLPILASR
jgi:hypothetical protein